MVMDRLILQVLPLSRKILSLQECSKKWDVLMNLDQA